MTELRVEIIRVTTSDNINITCIVIGDTVINIHGEIPTNIISRVSLGNIIAGNKWNDVGLLPLDILTLARQLGLDF